MDEHTAELVREVKHLSKWCGDSRWADRCNNWPDERLRDSFLPQLKRKLVKYQRELNQIEVVIAEAENILTTKFERAQPRLEKDYAEYINRRKIARQIVADRKRGMSWAQLKRKYQLTRRKLESSIRWIERCPRQMTKNYYFKTY